MASDLSARQILQQQAPKFLHAMSTYAPHIHTWLQSPDSSFTIFAPMDSGCTLDEYAKGMDSKNMDAVFRYHLASGRLILGDGPDLLETALEGEASDPNNIGVANHQSSTFSSYLPLGHRQRLKLFKQNGHQVVFDGELPPATVLNCISCVDGLVVLISRTLMPPLIVPTSVSNTPTKALLESIVQFGMADYRTTPLTLLVPVGTAMSEPFLKNAQLAGAHVCQGIHYSNDLHAGVILRTLTGNSISISDDGTNYYANGRKFIAYDVPTCFGVVHVLERDLVYNDVTASNSEQQVMVIGSGAVRPQSSTFPTSTATCLMLAGAVAVCLAIGYAAWRKSKR